MSGFHPIQPIKCVLPMYKMSGKWDSCVIRSGFPFDSGSSGAWGDNNCRFQGLGVLRAWVDCLEQGIPISREKGKMLE